MDFIKTSIKRPVTVIMGMFILILLGTVSVSKMHLSLMPEFKLPYVVVFTTYEDAGSQEVENLVSKPLERAISSVQNVKNIQSYSSNGTSILSVELEYKTDMNRAVSDINEAINVIQDFLPDDVSKPVTMKLNMDMMPIALIVASSPTMDDYKLRSFVTQNIQNRIERQEGVASVSIAGGSEKEIQVAFDENKLAGLNLDMNTIAQIMRSENTNLAGGKVNYADKSLAVSTKLQMSSIEDVKNMPIILPSGSVIKMSEISDISLMDKELTSRSRNAKNSSVLITVTKTSDANTVEAVKSLKKEIDAINKSYDNVQVEIAQESASLIQDSISALVKNIFIAAFLSMLVLLVFLKNIGLTAIIGISMPFSIIGTFVFLYFSGTTVNMVSLGGLSIGVGMLVDNSIVILENIYRYRTSLHYDKVRGTYLATNEMKTAVTASTLTTLVVFLPFIFAEGIVIQLMSDLALAVVFSLLMSLITSLTIVPMLSANYVSNVHRNKAEKLKFINKIFDKFDRFIKSVTKYYEKLLAWSMVHKKRVIFSAFAFFIFSLALIPFIGAEFLPASDEGQFTVTIETPKGSNLEYIDYIAKKAEDIIYSHDEVTNVTTTVTAVNDAMQSMFLNNEGASLRVHLVDKKHRKKSVDDIVEEIRQETKKIAGAKITAQATQSMMGGMSDDYDISVQLYGDDLNKLKELSNDFMKKMQRMNALRQIKSSIDTTENQVAIKLNKDKVRMYALSGAQVANRVKNSVSGLVATKLKQNGTETDVRLILPKTKNTSYSDIKNINIDTTFGTSVPLGEIADVSIENVASRIIGSDSRRMVIIKANIYGSDFGTVSGDIQKMIDSYKFPSGYYATMGDETTMMSDTFSSLLLVVLLAIVLTYMVMASQFESLINPFVIMFTIPFAFSGGFILLFLFRATLSVMSIIGGLVLVGIVVNNGIVLIDYINTLRYRDGLDMHTAIKTACPTRLRPILMTALTTILGQVPLIFSNGANSETTKSMALVIAGGLAVSTLLTLIIVPVMYMVFDRITEKFKAKFNIRSRYGTFELEELCKPLTKEEIETIQKEEKGE